MRREARLLLQKAFDSLVLSVEFFNRPHDRGRVSGSLILLDHAFEMLLKAGIIHKGGKIRDKRAKETIGFDACVRRALSDGKIKFLDEEQALLLQTINGMRDAAQHHLLEISEGLLYLHAQAGVTLFRDLCTSVFDTDLKGELPTRVLPISTTPPTSLAALFESEIDEIRKLLKPRTRRRVEAEARLRPLAILDSTIAGEKGQPSSSDLQRLGKRVLAGEKWENVFAGAASIDISPQGTGPSLSLRITKKEGIPIQLVPEGTPGATVVAVKRIDELGYYSLGATDLASKCEVKLSDVIVAVDYLGLRADVECYKEIRIGRSVFKRYSPAAIAKVKSCLADKSAGAMRSELKKRRGGETRG
jgi:hypothetical protein